MRILAIYRHYWPDATPYARLLRAILEDQAAQDRSVTVFTAQPGYNDIKYTQQPAREMLGGVDVRRIRLLPERKHLRVLRALNYLIFVSRAVLHVLLLRHYDLILANTHPPVLMGMALRLINRLTGIPYLLHCQDIHPESAVLAQQLKQGRISRWLQAMDAKSCERAGGVVVLSEDMKRTLRRRPGYLANNLYVVNNFALDVYQPADALPKIFEESPQRPFRVFFAGNMGHFQDLARLMEAAKLLRAEQDIQFIFMGAGAERKSLQQIASDLIGKTVFFEPHQPVEVAFACMKRSDLGVVSLRRGVCQVAYPSKTMTYLAAGCPLLLLAERESQLAADIVEHAFGYVPRDTIPGKIAQTILKARDERHHWTAAAKAALVKRSEAFYGRDNALVAWRHIFASYAANPAGQRNFPQPVANQLRRAA